MTAYPWLVEKVIKPLQTVERDCSEEAFFVRGTGVHQRLETPFLPVVES